VQYVSIVRESDGNRTDPTAYLDRLPELAASLPPGARSFATDTGHYDYYGKRCVKDLKLDQLQLGEVNGDTSLRLKFRHNCWKHEEDLTIDYEGVHGLALDLPVQPPEWSLLDDVILDEILPSQRGCSHEIEFLDGTITVHCRDLTATWTEADCPDKPTT
jgi:hypothetical protein